MQYMNIIDILKSLLRGGSTTGKNLHMSSMRQMHLVYLQKGIISMQRQFNKLRILYEAFIKGQHDARRIERFWAILSTDHTIDQVLMCSIKTTEGFIRGNGTTISIYCGAMTMLIVTKIACFINKENTQPSYACWEKCLEKAGYDIKHATGYAEAFIVQIAISAATEEMQ
ncbi:hypothetical protein CHS0354_040141 [Potamilus streckersoni]|uniref:Uncharacterized protein n=1 Tax=Potamilus streckersoni TaxID=2493646 RepID=A0AAE0SSP5_9BIVA|nr:hypothetical protein CHS0354_040141 [Potamilus streckersoni]